MEPGTTPLHHEQLPFDLSILTDRAKHAGFFCVLFLDDGRVQAHYDKMDANKFGHVVDAVLDTAIKQDVSNIDNMIAALNRLKADIIKKQNEAVFEEIETKPLTKLEEDIMNAVQVEDAQFPLKQVDSDVDKP